MTINRSTLTTFGVLVIIILIAVGYFVHVQKKNAEEAKNNTDAAKALSAPNYAQYTDTEGNPLALQDYFGDMILAFSWASWCPQCQEQFDILNQIQTQYPDLVILAFNRAEDKTTAEGYLRSQAVSDDITLVLDPSDHFYKSIGGYAVPEVVLYASDGTKAAHIRGVASLPNLQQQLSVLTQETQ